MNTDTARVATLVRHYVTSELRLLELLPPTFTRENPEAEYAWDAVVSGLIMAGFLDRTTFEPLLYNKEALLVQGSENRNGES